MAARRLLQAPRRFDQQGVAGRVAEGIVDRLELVEVEAVERELAGIAARRAQHVFELLLEHAAVGQAGQHVVEGELGDALLALGDLADHFVEARRQPRQLVGAADLDLNRLARGQPPGRLVEPGERLGDARGGLPGRERHQHQPQKRHGGKRQLELAGVGQRFGLWISEQEDGALALDQRRKRLGEGDRGAPPTFISNAAALPTCRSASAADGPPMPPMLPAASYQRPCPWASTAACSGIADSCSRPRISRRSRSAANTTQPIRLGAMIGAATSWRGRPPSTDTPLSRPASSGVPQAAASRRANVRSIAGDMPVGGDDEGAAYFQPGGGIAEGGPHGRLVAGGDRCAKAEVPRQQLRRALQLVRALLPQAVVDRAARLQLARHLARSRAGDEGRQGR